jgi:hypothetical protein
MAYVCRSGGSFLLVRSCCYQKEKLIRCEYIRVYVRVYYICMHTIGRTLSHVHKHIRREKGRESLLLKTCAFPHISALSL